MNISVCVGSSCHLRGAREVLYRFQELVSEYKLENQVTITSAFCLGHCTKGVSVFIEEELIHYVTPETIDEVFKEKVLSKL